MKLEMWVSVGFCPRLREYHVLIYILCRSCSQSVKVFTTFLYFDEDLMPDIYFWTLVDWGAVPKVYIFTNIRTLTRWKYVYIYILSPYTIFHLLGIYKPDIERLDPQTMIPFPSSEYLK